MFNTILTSPLLFPLKINRTFSTRLLLRVYMSLRNSWQMDRDDVNKMTSVHWHLNSYVESIANIISACRCLIYSFIPQTFRRSGNLNIPYCFLSGVSFFVNFIFGFYYLAKVWDSLQYDRKWFDRCFGLGNIGTWGASVLSPPLGVRSLWTHLVSFFWEL